MLKTKKSDISITLIVAVVIALIILVVVLYIWGSGTHKVANILNGCTNK